eukprot:6490965-Amphidinium_carterae.1
MGHRTRAADTIYQEHLLINKPFRPLPSSLLASDMPSEQKVPFQKPPSSCPNEPLDDEEIPLWVPNRQALLAESQAIPQDEPLATIDVVKHGASWTTTEQGLTISMTIAPPLESQRKKAMVIFHGSFAPMHPGHCAMINDALDFLYDNDIDVRVAGLSVTMDPQLAQKHGQIPRGWAAKNRIQFARYMLVDANLDQVVSVADRGFSSPHAHATSLGLDFPAIYVYGSDRWKHAATTKIDSHNLVVMRGADSCTPSFDQSRLAGKCNQTSGDNCRSISSSGVRSSLDAQHVPECYGRLTTEYLSTVFGPEEEEAYAGIPVEAHVHEEIVYTEEDDWPVAVEEDFHDALDDLPLSPDLHVDIGVGEQSTVPLATDSCAAAAISTVAASSGVTFAKNKEVKEYLVDNASCAAKKHIVRPAWLPQPRPLDDILSDDEHLEEVEPDFHDLPEQQDVPGFCSTYLSLSEEHLALAGAHRDWTAPTWRRWIRRPDTPSYYSREEAHPAQAHQVWNEALLAGPSGLIEIHYPIVPVQEHGDDWNWDHLIVCVGASAVRESFELDSKVLARVPKGFVMQRLGPTRPFYKQHCTVVRAHVELVNHWFTTHLAPDTPIDLPRRGWVTLCVKPDDPTRTDLALTFYRRATCEDRYLCRDQDVHFAKWQNFAPLKYTGVNNIEREDPDIPPSQFAKIFDYLTGVATNLLPNQANERIRAWLERHPRALAGSSGIHLPATTIAPHPNVMKYSGDVRVMPVHVLAPIRGCVGSIHEVTLVQPHSTLPSFAPDDPAWSWQSIVCALEDDIPIRETASPSSRVIGFLFTHCLCRMIGRPRYVNMISCVRMEVLTPHFWDSDNSEPESICGGYIILTAALAGGQDYFRPATPEDEILLYEQVPLHSVQLLPHISAELHGHWRRLSPEDAQEIAFVKALVVKALPDKELQCKVDQLHEPPVKAPTEGRRREIPTASCIQCSPLSFVPPLPDDRPPMTYTRAFTKRGGAHSESSSVATHLAASQDNQVLESDATMDTSFQVTCHLNSRVPVSDFSLPLPSSLISVDQLTAILANRKHVAKARVCVTIAGAPSQVGDWIFLDTAQTLQFFVLPPFEDRKRRKRRRRASSTPPTEELAHDLLVEALTPSKVVWVCPTENDLHPIDHAMVAHCGGTNSCPMSAEPIDPDRVKNRKRPLPIGTAFHNVMIFPAPDLWQFIDTTTYYIVQSGRRFDFENRVKNAFGDKVDFMDVTSDLHPFYLACLRFHVKHNPPMAQPLSQEDDVVLISETQTIPQQKKRKLHTGTPDLRTAVNNVYARRRKAGIDHHIPYHEVVSEAMADGLPLQPDSVMPFATPSRSLTPKHKAMPRPKVILSPACTKVAQKPSPIVKSVRQSCSSHLWEKYIHPWALSPRSHGGVMKIPAPLHCGLGEFASNAVNALMVLLNTRIISVARRALDPFIRVRYVRDLAGAIHPRALNLCQTLEEFRMFYTVLNDLASNIVTYDYHEFFLKADGGFHILFNRSHECRQAISSALGTALKHLQAHAQQSHACVAILLFEAHTLIVLALRSTLHALESRRLEIGNILTKFLQQTPIHADDKQYLIVPHRVEWKGGSIQPDCVLKDGLPFKTVYLAFEFLSSLGEMLLLKSIYVANLFLLHSSSTAGKPQFQCCGCSSTTGLARCQYCLHTACKYHMFYIPALNGGDLACVHCRTIEIDQLRPCRCGYGHCLSPVLHCGGALRLVLHSPAGKSIHDLVDDQVVTVRQFLDAQGWINERLIWHQHVLHPDLIFKDYKMDFLVLLVLPDTSNTDEMSVIRPFRDCRASDTWSLAEFSFWHSYSAQNYVLAAHCTSIHTEYFGLDSMDFMLRDWLADIIDKRNIATAAKNSWRHVKRTIHKQKRQSSTCTTALVYESVIQPSLFDPPGISFRGGASDSAIKQKLAKKVSQAGVQHAQDLIQLIWSDNASELRQLWGSAPEVRSKLLAMARNSDHVLDLGKFFPTDPVFEGDPWSKFSASKAEASDKAAAKAKPFAKQTPDTTLQIAKFDQQILLSELVTTTGTTLPRLQMTEPGANSKGYLLCHSANLASMWDKAQVTPGPLALLSHRAATLAGQSPSAHVQVVVQAGDSKKVMHLAVYLRGNETVEVKQHGKVLSVPEANTVEIMIELYEEFAPPSLFLNFLKKDGIGTLLGDLKVHYTPQVARPHRVTGECPTRIVRCFGSVPAAKLLQTLTLSGQNDCIIKPCQRHVEDHFNLTNVWASSTDRSLVMQQISTIKHHGIVRTRTGRFIIRCALDQVAAVRQQVAADDLRYAQAPGLVITRKWKVHHVPVAITAQSISDALRTSLSWSQIPIGPSCSRTKAATWTVTLGSGQDAPSQDQVLVDNSICLIVEIGAKAPVPQATMSVVQSQVPCAQVSTTSSSVSYHQVIQEKLRQAEQSLSCAAQNTIEDLVEENVDKRFERLTTLEDQVAKLSVHLVQADAHTQQVGQQVAQLAYTVEQRQMAMQSEMKEITNTLETHRSHTDQVIKQLDASFLIRMKALGTELITQLKPATGRQAGGNAADDDMES